MLMHDATLQAWVITPLLIFLARSIDVSIGTIRIILLSQGKKRMAAMLGFFEMLIWLIAIQQIFQNLSNVACYIGYAGGFAMGNYIGILIEERLAMGTVVVRAITKANASHLILNLKEHGYGVTSLDAEGTQGKVSVIFTIVKRSEAQTVIKIIREFNSRAFYSVENIRAVSQGTFPARNRKWQINRIMQMRK